MSGSMSAKHVLAFMITFRRVGFSGEGTLLSALKGQL